MKFLIQILKLQHHLLLINSKYKEFIDKRLKKQDRTYFKSDEQISRVLIPQNNYYINCNFLKLIVDLISLKFNNNPVNSTLTNSHKINTDPSFGIIVKITLSSPA